MESFKVAIVGGGGHVGLPLAIELAISGNSVTIFDTDKIRIETIKDGIFPFSEIHGGDKLKEALGTGRLYFDSIGTSLKNAEIIIIVVGTPVDEHLNPDMNAIRELCDTFVHNLNNNQVLILRSTVFPGVTRSIAEYLSRRNLACSVVAAPERILEGKAFEEIKKIPQILGSLDERGKDLCQKLFSTVTQRIIHCTPEEAELAKLFSNAWRYSNFATVNEFYRIALNLGQNFEKIHSIMKYDYPRNAGLPKPMFSAGPCLPKDTLQLVSVTSSGFRIGEAAYSVNENLPNVLVEHLSLNYPLSNLKVLILGMAFKIDSDDTRSSLSFKLKKLLEFKCLEVLCHDPHIEGINAKEARVLLEKADIALLVVPHSDYLEIMNEEKVVDIWKL
jgi:UDP-N-acetyl-D-mannosaminuronic acid dehydrogenase